MADRPADLAGPGISTYEDVAKVLPRDYRSLLAPKDSMRALFAAKRYIENNLCRELNHDDGAGAAHRGSGQRHQRPAGP